MALGNSKKFRNTNVDVTYFTVGIVSIDFLRKVAHAELVGYQDRDRYTDGKIANQLARTSFDFKGAEFTFEKSDDLSSTIAKVYGLIKDQKVQDGYDEQDRPKYKDGPWKNSTDVIEDGQKVPFTDPDVV